MILFGNRVFTDIIKVRIEMRSYCMESNDRVLIRTEKGDVGTSVGGHLKTEAEIGVNFLQGQLCQGLLALTRS